MNLDALAAILVAAGLATEAEIFQHNMPDVSAGVLFRMPLEGIRRDHELPGRYKHRLQVIVRGTATAAVRAKATLIAAALTMHETALPGTYVTYIREDTLPILYPRSEQGASVEASINFDCCYVML